MGWLDRFIRLDFWIAKMAVTSSIIMRQGIKAARGSLLSGQQELIGQ